MNTNSCNPRAVWRVGGLISFPTLAALQIRFCGVRDSVIGKWREGSEGLWFATLCGAEFEWTD